MGTSNIWECLFEKESEWQVTVSGFFDESGKFNDHKVISIGCIAHFAEQMNDFGREWKYLLNLNGLKYLTAKKVLNHKHPLSDKVSALGASERNKTLVPFIKCIRKHLSVAMGFALDVRAFKKLPPHFFQVYGHDPSYLAFVRTFHQIIDFTPSNDKAVLVCDEDEETAIPFYRLYRRVKQVLPQARRTLAAISFADDKVLFGLQAADLIASVVRLNVTARLMKKPYDYRQLYRALQAQPEKHERIWFSGVAIADKKTLLNIARETEEDLRRRKLL